MLECVLTFGETVHGIVNLLVVGPGERDERRLGQDDAEPDVLPLVGVGGVPGLGHLWLVASEHALPALDA